VPCRAAFFAIATILATCSQIQATLLPTYLHKELGYSLSFSGASFTLFGIGGILKDHQPFAHLHPVEQIDQAQLGDGLDQPDLARCH
jgi:hypothetical protein